MEIDASRQLSPFFPDSRLLSYSGDEDRRGASQRWDSTPPDSNVKRAAWRNNSSKKAFVATLVTLACMLVFKTKEATWCWNNECGFAEFRGLDFTVMQKMVDMRAASQSPRSNFPGEDSTLSGVVVSGSNMTGAGERSDSMQQSPERETLHTSRVTENSGCKGKADCPAEKLCVSKVCTCPVLYSGDHLCKSPTPGLAPGCITPITSPRLQQFARLRNISLPTPDFSVNNDTLRRSGRSTDLTQTAHKFWSNIQDLADFSTCAVVGSSSSLLSKDPARSFGAEIDDHSAVIRFNDAPTHGFEEWVGTKTTLRIQNVIYCGFKETPGEFCFRYTSKERRDGHIDMRATCRNPFRCRPINGTSEMLIYAMAYWQLSSLNVEHDTHDQPALPSDKYLRKMSAGFFGLALAAHLCGKVDAYGFDSGELHYYIKSPNLKHKTKSQCTLAGCKSKNSFSQRHSWRQENVCLAHLLGGGIPRLHIRTRPGQPV